jgi:hypothetical protein
MAYFAWLTLFIIAALGFGSLIYAPAYILALPPAFILWRKGDGTALARWEGVVLIISLIGMVLISVLLLWYWIQ